MKEVNNKHARFQDADWFQVGPKTIVVGGAGGIGSWVTLFLSRIGHKLYVYDNDTIDETNMAGQLYRINQIGVNKAAAITEIATQFSECEVNPLGLYTLEDGLVSPIMFSCFDNMAARKAMFDNWCAQEDRELFVDGRMLAEVGMVFIVQKGEEAAYRAELFSDEEVEEAPCSFKATSHCGAFIGSLMTSGLNNYLTNVKLGGNFRIVQFRTDFELPLFTVMESKPVVEEPTKEVTEDVEVSV